MDILFNGIELDKVSTSFTINATAGIILGFYIFIAKKRNLDIKNLSGTIQNDILKEFAARGNYIYPVEQSVRLVGDIIEFCSKYMPKWNPISISGIIIESRGDAVRS
jgi:methylmalonyl-CoA mutase (EC 5.4.99.2)